MPLPIDFYFDFSSPFGYFASRRIDELAARSGRDTVWRPYLMGAIFKITGRQPLVQHPLVKDYAIHDMQRSARLYDIPFRYPSKFPLGSVAACRAYYWLYDRDPDQAKTLARAIYTAYFVDDRDISAPQQILDIAASCGIERTTLETALGDPAVKERLRLVNDEAAARKIFGSPFVMVDGEPFWGNDRLDQVEQWLETGGW